MQEIERKFLVTSNDFKLEHGTKKVIAQGYLNSDPDRTVRVRISDQTGYITVKGMGNKSGITRFEWEKEISLIEAEKLLFICEPGIIQKVRYCIPYGKHTYEVDVFERENAGLVVAEIELTSEDEFFKKPLWLGEEVTGIEKYYNGYISNNPYNTWK